MQNNVNKNRIRVASIFSGCGGSDLGILGGFSFNGKSHNSLPFEIVFALDNDAKAVETYNANFNHPAVVADITKHPIKDIPNFDLLLGGFPCQSFSTVNPTKNPFDDRAKLYKRMARILKEKKPKFFIAENVKGLVVLKKGGIFKQVLKEFEKQGYKTYWHLVKAADYGIPQKRVRVFIIGIRKDLSYSFAFPTPSHSEFGVNGKKQWVGLGSVIDSISDVDKKYYFSEKAVLGMKKAKNNMKRGLAQDLEAPCLTVTSHLAKVSLNSRDPVLLVNAKKELYRRFTPLEAARIQSFPDNFKFVGSDANAYHQIGNAIPPVLMWHVAKALSDQILDGGYIHKAKKERDNVTDSLEEYNNRETSILASA